jgi:hypothetical protein
VPEDWPLPAESRLTLIHVPLVVPYRFADAHCSVEGDRSTCDVERWFPPAALPPSVFTIPAGTIQLPGDTPNPTLSVPIGFSTHNRRSALRFENQSFATSYSALIGGADVGSYYFHGFDPQPSFEVSAAALGAPDPNPNNPLHLKLRGETIVQPVFKHVDAWGADLAYAFERFTLRTEVAYIDGRPFRPRCAQPGHPCCSGSRNSPRRSPPWPAVNPRCRSRCPRPYVTRDAVEWGIGVDYLLAGWLLLLQANQNRCSQQHYAAVDP